jgi:hypothetical protein
MNRCRVCGLDLGVCTWSVDGTFPTYIICDCCGAEAGYHDCSVTACRKHRQIWLSTGAKWHDPEYKPADWSLDEQLRHVPTEYL